MLFPISFFPLDICTNHCIDILALINAAHAYVQLFTFETCNVNILPSVL